MITSMDRNHFIREIQQISLIQKKLHEILSETPQAKQIPFIIDHLDSTRGFATSIVDNISLRKIKITDDLLSALNHELRTPLVPIRAYADMLSRGDFGALNQEQQKRIELLVSNAKQLQQKIESLLGRDTLDVFASSLTDHRVRELEQEKIVLEKINRMLDDKIKEDRSEIKELKKDLADSEFQKIESEQANRILDKTVRMEEKKSNRLAKKNLVVIAVSALVVGVGLSAYSVYVTDLAGKQYQISNLGNINPGGYVIQNLRGDTIDTWLSWRLVQGSTLHVGIINGERFPEKIPLIKEVVESEKSIEVDDSLLHKGPKGSTSTYYVGWQGALEHASENPTDLYIPSKLQVLESSRGEGDITVILSNERNGDGYSGFTRSIADDSQNQILKSTITIYDTGALNGDQFKTILRHEFGHALGLAHSTAPEDLMAPVVMTSYPYISDCDLSTIVKLYDGGKNSQVTCEK
ncbi:MAG: matrixin family metalloprotease [Candidatus Nitrosotenuis sp.]|nr:MAG: matrixin family metalloprotease [Candidatus Nitrosotenuis sp.]